MPKYKLSKSDEQWLRKEAKKLPPDQSQTGMKQAISGKAVALSGYAGKKINGEPIDPNATYITRVPNVISMNHFRRLKKAYEEQEWVGVNKYLDKYRVEEDKIFKTVPKQTEPVKKSLMQKIRDKFA